MRNLVCLALVAVAGIVPAQAFQIAPLSTKWEERLTREKTHHRAKVADFLGRNIKAPVHEEIAQLAMGCITANSNEDLPVNQECASADLSFANQYIIYGVRWNDLPPFSLYKGEGRKCTKVFGGGPACVAQTIRFATQPDCWYCLFKAAEKIAASKRKIVGCLPPKREKGSRVITGNLLARSHYGDLQFLHGMAQEDGEEPGRTRADILGWLEFAWKVSSREISRGTLLRDVNIPVMKDRFHCSGWSVADLYVQGNQDSLLRFLQEIALGSVLHTIQDSFADGHLERATAPTGQICADTQDLPKPGAILEFHSYSDQDGDRHDTRDKREAMTGATGGRVSWAVEASRRVVDHRGLPWDSVKPYMNCLFELSPDARPASAGEAFRRR